ncbi:MAG: hypothetical protein EOO28_11940 [Comamonadaceae bacterium]|nr:MAG: hypothetical protein EOO28_11940 [Comamonadaceae bacterium]
MARRKKTSTAEDLIELVAMLPWWVGVALAVVSYFVLHGIATSPMPAAKTAQEMGQLAASSIWRAVAYAGQFALPFICVLGAVASAVGRWRRRQLVTTVSESKAADALDGMTWQQFELLVGEGFRRQGYSVTEAGGAGPDGGVDLVLAKSGEKFLVQCKQWKAFKVGVTVVRELYGVMAARGATGGFVVTSGQFTAEAVAFASGRNIKLVDGPALLRLIREDSASREPPARARPAAPVQTAPAKAAFSATPTCPKCASPMIRRVAKRGTSAGNQFWGCSSFPGCKGTLPI